MSETVDKQELFHNKTRFTIGEVSQISSLSRKSLRFYEEKGLLIPSARGENNYRYYTSDQVQDAIIISSLKRRGFSYPEISKLFSNCPTAEDVYTALDEKVEDIQSQIDALEQKLEQTKTAAEQIRRAISAQEGDSSGPNEDDIEISYLPARNVIYTRYSSYINANQVCWWDRVAEIYKMCAEYNYTITGPMSAIYHEHFLNQFFFDYGDTEVFIPISDDVPQSKHVKKMDGHLIASKMHRGPYRELLPVYVSLVKSIESSGYKVVGPSMEEYLIEFTQGANENDFITRVCFPIEENSDPEAKSHLKSPEEAEEDSLG